MEYPDVGVQQAIGNMGPGARRDLDLGVIYTQGVIGGHDLPSFFFFYMKHTHCVFYFL